MAAYNNYFPASYQPMYQQLQYQQPVQIQQPQMQQQTQVGLIRVPSEEVARSYPLALNTSGTFIDENRPYIYTKTMPASQFEPPKFEKYRLVKEEDDQQLASQSQVQTEYITRDEFEKRLSEIAQPGFQNKVAPTTRKAKAE